MINTLLEKFIHSGWHLVSFLPMHTCMDNLNWICLATTELLAALQNCSLMRLDQSQSQDHEPLTFFVANIHSSILLHVSPFFCFPAFRHYVNIRWKHVQSSLCGPNLKSRLLWNLVHLLETSFINSPNTQHFALFQEKPAVLTKILGYY